jgi:hypothetical protein
MSKSQNDDDVKNKRPEVGDRNISKIEDMADIHSTSDSARHIERAQQKKVEVTEGNETGSWQIREKTES